MVPIASGTFQMGSPENEEGRWNPEGPQHEVRIGSPFEIGAMPVTQALYESVMGSNPSHFEGDDRPVEQVSWCDVILFCNRLSELEGLKPAYRVPEELTPGMDPDKSNEVAVGVVLIPGSAGFRLPSEAEWEYAARAGTGTRFWSGDAEADLERVGWYDENSGDETHSVGQKPANAWGLHDVHGNVFEWCEDDVHGNYAGAPTDGSAWLDEKRGSFRVARGGSWNYYPSRARVANRYRNDPGYRNFYLGFRLARSSGSP